MFRKFVLSIVFLSSVFLFSSINSYGQVITGAIKNLYMIAELPIPNSDRSYELKVFFIWSRAASDSLDGNSNDPFFPHDSIDDSNNTINIILFILIFLF